MAAKLHIPHCRCSTKLKVALEYLLEASAPYEDKAAPHEHLFNGDDLLNFARLVAARRAAEAALA